MLSVVLSFLQVTTSQPSLLLRSPPGLPSGELV